MSRADDDRLADILESAAKLAARVDAVDFESSEPNEDLRLVTERLVEAAIAALQA